VLAGIESDIRQGIDVVIMTESWLNRDEVNFFDLTNYDAYHSLRDGRGYGGVSVYVKKHILTNVLEVINEKSGEFLILNFPIIKINLIAVYRPPSNIQTEIELFINKLDYLFSTYGRGSLTFGDMNLDLLDLTKPGVESFVETVLSNGQLFINRLTDNFCTRDSSRTIIDHVITDLVLENSIFSLDRRPISDHNLIFLSLGLPNCNNKPKFAQTKQIIDFEAIRASSNFVEEVNRVNNCKELIDTISSYISQNSRVVALSKKNKNLGLLHNFLNG
jgi:hypothetical protein